LFEQFFYFHGKGFVLINCDQKIGWATFWAIYRQTDLVTLFVSAQVENAKTGRSRITF
jgi:hypothetical protein